MTMNEAAELYFDLKQGLMKKSSFVNIYRMYCNHIKIELGNVEINEITSRTLQKFYNSLATVKCLTDSSKNLSESTIKDIVTLAKTILYFAMEEGEMQERRYKLRKPYGMRIHENNQDKYLDEKYYKELLHTCMRVEDGTYRKSKVFTMLAITTGMRIGEACGIQWKNIDFSNSTIEINKTVQRILNIDGSSYINVGSPKSKSSNRTVVMPSSTRKMLEEYKEIVKPNNEEFYVLGNEKTTEPRTVRESYRRFLNFMKIPYIHPHALRHTFATYTISNGGDVKTISMLLGHANTGITLDTYTHITKRQIKNTSDKLNDIFD